MLPRVKSVKATPGHLLEILFISGEVGLYVCSPLLDFGVFSEFKDERYFQQAHVVNGTVGWAARTGYLSGHALSGRDSAVILKRFQDNKNL